MFAVKHVSLSLLSLVFMATLPSLATAQTQCLAIADTATGTLLKHEGAGCEQRITRASTFKIAISLMGFDSGVLKYEHSPALPFKEGYSAWRPSWKQTTDPAYWMKESVVWYSQEITPRIGAQKFAAYLKAFNYGNADASGDKGKNNGLTRAWLSSSLQISPMEQMAFLTRIVKRDLAVSDHAYDMTGRITKLDSIIDGWEVHGKTGAGAPRNADGSLAESRSYGWFVGWATKGERKIVFVHQIQDEAKQEVSPGFRARDALLAVLPDVLAKIEQP